MRAVDPVSGKEPDMPLKLGAYTACLHDRPAIAAGNLRAAAANM